MILLMYSHNGALVLQIDNLCQISCSKSTVICSVEISTIFIVEISTSGSRDLEYFGRSLISFKIDMFWKKSSCEYNIAYFK